MLFDQVNLTSTEFQNTYLKGIDISTCMIRNTRFDIWSLKGALIDPFQAVDLITLLGVIVKYPD